MNINAYFKFKNVRSLNLSQGLEKTGRKINALTHEANDMIFIINTQIGKKTRVCKSVRHSESTVVKAKMCRDLKFKTSNYIFTGTRVMEEQLKILDK